MGLTYFLKMPHVLVQSIRCNVHASISLSNRETNVMNFSTYMSPGFLPLLLIMVRANAA